jgi:hypothetical protein
MEYEIECLLGAYEHGRLSRRQLVRGLAVVATAASAAPASGSTFQGVAINHIALRATNIPRSRDFYQKLLGLPILQESEGNCFLGIGKNTTASQSRASSQMRS